MNASNLVRLPLAAEAMKIDPKTLRRRIADGTVKGYRLGPRLLYVDLDELTEALTPKSKDQENG
jgi:hypothetical protein